MARRTVLLVVAALIALVGTSLIVLYVQNVDERATRGQELVEVLTVTSPLESGESVAAAIEQGKFEKTQVRRDDVVEGALTTTEDIAELVATSPIYPGEQVIGARFGTVGDTSALVVPPDMTAISVDLTDPARVAGFVNPGSEVAIFMSADPSLYMPDGSQKQLPPYTGVLLPRVQVIGVGATTVTSKTVTDESGAAITEQVPRTILTVAVDQEQAEKLIYGARNGELYFALLSKESKIQSNSGVTADEVIPDAFEGIQVAP